MSNPESVKVVSSILYTEGQQKLNRQVAEEIKIPDPEEEVAAAAIKEATKKEQ